VIFAVSDGESPIPAVPGVGDFAFGWRTSSTRNIAKLSLDKKVKRYKMSIYSFIE
jgi:hypothetical protein